MEPREAAKAVIAAVKRSARILRSCHCLQCQFRGEVFATLRRERREALVKRWTPWK